MKSIDLEKKQKFVELRGAGLSFDKIAAELNVSKPTLISWNQELYHEVKEAQFYELESLLENYKLMRKQRFELYCKLLSSALEELENRATEAHKFNDIPTDKLLSMVQQLEKRIQRETESELVAVHINPDFTFGTQEFLEAG